MEKCLYSIFLQAVLDEQYIFGFRAMKKREKIHADAGQIPSKVLDLMLDVILEVMSFHIDRGTELAIEEEVESAGVAVYWRDGSKDNVERLYQAAWGKVPLSIESIMLCSSHYTCIAAISIVVCRLDSSII